ncbi:MAG: PhnD/SsuA/transferrin family substrate-binding protein, partial [Desulfobacterales bacterium]|nr:PhnD/SsuA/transferrin family substrate-binding protein [Desulfobacterales bacterium]
MNKSILTLSMVILLIFPIAVFSEEPLKIGVAAMISPKDTFKYYKQLLDYVGEKIGNKVEIVQRPTYAEMDSLLKEEKVQIAFLCSGPYVNDKKEFGVELLVAPVSYGQPFYYAYIIVPKNSSIKSLSELEGKKFVFTDPHSNTGCIVPTYMIAKRF